MKIPAKIKALPWKLIMVFAAIALVRPVIKIIADFRDSDISTMTTIIISVIIAIIWIAMAIALHLKKPVLILAAAGAVYGAVAIAMAVIIHIVAPDKGSNDASIAILLTAGLLGTTIFNIVYGAGLGFIASAIQDLRKA